MDIRVEYMVVRAIDVIIIKDRIHSSLDEIIFSIIISFEKNLDKNGIPINAILVIPKVEDTKGMLVEDIPIIRVS